MTEWLLALVPQYGSWLLAAGTFLACLALPVPASMLMLAAGGFVSAGDLSLAGSAGAAFAGATAGDQLGFAAGQRGGAGLRVGSGGRAKMLSKATELLATRGSTAVFLSRWLLSALGPYVNLAAGAVRMPWRTFTFWAMAGEAVWVGLYVGLGYAFTGNLAAASAMALNVLGFLAAGAVAIGLGLWLMSALKAEQAA